MGVLPGYPFEPPWEDLKMTVVTDKGVKCYIFDTCCKNETPEQRAETKRRIGNIIYQSELRKRMQKKKEVEK